MADWTNIPDATFDPDRPVLGSTHLAIVKNFEALAEGAANAPRVLTPAINDAAVTTAKIANANVTTAKLAVATRSFSGSLSDGAQIILTFADEFAFSPRVTGGGSFMSATFVGNNSLSIVNRDNQTQTYAVTWRYFNV